MGIKSEIKTIEQDVIVDIVCDICYKTTNKSEDSEQSQFEYATLYASWGYWSKKDDTRWNYYLCESCADKVVEFLSLGSVDTEYRIDK